jgi:hypothetical protein
MGIMEKWHTGISGLFCIALKNIMIDEINQSWIEKTSAEDLKAKGLARCDCLYGLAGRVFVNVPFGLK